MRRLALSVAVLTLALPAGDSLAEVIIETVPVGNLGNTGEWSGVSYGGCGPDRICGAVDYAYNIGTYEVTARQYCEFLNDVAESDPHALYSSRMDGSYGCQITQNGGSGNYTYDFSGRPSGTEADWEDRPVNYVSWYDAAMFCNWLTSGNIHQGAYDTTTGDPVYWGDSDISKYTGITPHNSPEMDALVATYGEVWVIPTEDEWYKVAYHKNDGDTGNYYDYPTSSDTAPSNDLIDPDPGNNATFYDGDYTIGSPYYRTQFGAHEASESPYDTFDQCGNVWEWNEEILYGLFRGLRGGSFGSFGGSLHAASRLNGDGLPTNQDGHVGVPSRKYP